MKKVLKLACLAAFALVIAGCGKRGQVPEKTVIAAYVDLEKMYDNGKELAEALIASLPVDARDEAKKGMEEAIKEIDKYKDMLRPEWMVVACGGDFKSLVNSQQDCFAVVVRVKADEATIEKLLKEDGFDGLTPGKREGGVVYDLGRKFVGLVDGKYLIASPSKDAFGDMFDLYAGKTKPSAEFNDLPEITGSTVCRVSTAPVSSLLTRFELTREIEKFGEACEDEDLADMILSVGAVSLDVWMDKEDVGLLLRVKCGSVGDAKTLEHFFHSIAFSSRVACDVAAYAGKEADKFGLKARDLAPLQNVFIDLSRTVDAGRDGNVAVLSCALGAERISEIIQSGTSALSSFTRYGKSSLRVAPPTPKANAAPAAPVKKAVPAAPAKAAPVAPKANAAPAAPAAPKTNAAPAAPVAPKTNVAPAAPVKAAPVAPKTNAAPEAAKAVKEAVDAVKK